MRRVLVPPYWTSVMSVAFSFTPFADNTSGIRGYEWGLGSQPGLDNVIPFRPFTGTTMVNFLSVSILRHQMHVIFGLYCVRRVS